MDGGFSWDSVKDDDEVTNVDGGKDDWGDVLMEEIQSDGWWPGML